jgi:hypothetical protein
MNDHLGTRREDKNKDTSARTEGHDMNKIPLDGVSAFLSTDTIFRGNTHC